MGRKSWATENQQKWLTDTVPRFREAQRQKKVGEFKQEVIAAFLQKFPLKITTEDSDDEEIPTDDTEENGVEYTKAPSLKKARSMRFLSSLL